MYIVGEVLLVLLPEVAPEPELVGLANLEELEVVENVDDPLLLEEVLLEVKILVGVGVAEAEGLGWIGETVGVATPLMTVLEAGVTRPHFCS